MAEHKPVAAGVFMPAAVRESVCGPRVMERLQAMSGQPPLMADVGSEGWEEVLAGTEALVLSWGSPALTGGLLDALPNLELVLYAAGSIKHLITEEFTASGIPICSAAVANAIPVAEFTFAAIIFSLKRAWQLAGAVRSQRGFPEPRPVIGAFGATVGLTSMGMIGRKVAERLAATDLKVLAYDPRLTQSEADALGVDLVDLPTLFARSDVVSLHTPMLEATRGMVHRDLLRLMKPDATLINTARGGLIVEEDLAEAARARPDLQFVLDVTLPEPPAKDSPLYDLPNVFLTPHIAGAFGNEQQRLGLQMADEVGRFRKGEQLQHQVDLAALDVIA